MIRRLKPYGRVWPARRFLKIWLLGIRDGWQQPHDLSTSINIDHLANHTDAYESLDAGINLGQWLRSPLNHEQGDS